MTSVTRLLLLILHVSTLSLLLAGCAAKKPDLSDLNAEDLYQSARKSLSTSDYDNAIEKWELLERKFPFSPYAKQSLMEVIYAHYNYKYYDAAIASATRFLRRQPNHQHVDYVLYIKGLSSFKQEDDFLTSTLPIDANRRDLSHYRAAFRDFFVLTSKYPNSKYTADARQRMIYMRNAIAEKELAIADYYIQRKAHLAAINRAKYVLRNLPGTPFNARALKVLSDSYAALNMEPQQQDVIATYETNFPDGAPLEADSPLWQMLWPFE